MLLLLLLFLTQDQETLVPVQPGNTVAVGNYQVTVPEDLLFAVDQDAEVMYRLASADFIPNCAGILFSKNDIWTFCGVVQHYPYQPYYLQPSVRDGYFEAVFSKRHLYFPDSYEGDVSFPIPPTFDWENNTFTIGAHYQGENPAFSGYFIRKIFVSDQEAILLSIRVSTFDEYLKNETAINAMINAITPTGAEAEPVAGEPSSYMTLLGLPDPLAMFMGQTNSETEGLSVTTIATSVLLALFGISLLLYASQMIKKAEREKELEKGEGEDLVEHETES